MNIGPVSSLLPPIASAARVAMVTPFKRDRDGDRDSDKVETTRGEATQVGRAGQRVDFEA